MNQIHYLNGKQVKSPFNHEELSIEIQFDADGNERQSSITRFEWRDKEAALITQIKDYASWSTT